MSVYVCVVHKGDALNYALISLLVCQIFDRLDEVM